MTRSQDTLHWSADRHLTWDDFQGKPESNTRFGAITNAVVRYSLTANDDSFQARVICFFKKSSSWSKYKQDEALLSHEQGHFDIAELFARKLRKAISQYSFNYSTVGSDIEKLFVNVKKERARMDSLYDKETNLSMNIEQQRLWSKKIRAALKQLDKYADNSGLASNQISTGIKSGD
jgi:hypothetical protein